MLQSNAEGRVNTRAGHRQQSEKGFSAFSPYLEVKPEVSQKSGTESIWLARERGSSESGPADSR